MEFVVETTIHASAERIYQTWLDSDGHSEMTGSIAIITEDIGDKFTAWDGYIWGTTLETKENSYIRQTWRTTDFSEEQEASIVEVFFEPQGDDATSVKIKHSNLTDADGEYEKGWVDFYFTPMKEYFGH